MVRKLTRSRARLGELEAGELSVRASISSAYTALPERSSRAFRLLALLGPADFAEWVIDAVLGEPGTAGVADDLVRRSLLIPAGVDATGEPRYRLHDLLRDYAAERLAADPAPDTAAAQDRLLQAWLQLARQANANLPPEPYFPPLKQAPPPAVIPEELAADLTANPIAWFTAERINLLAAIEQACDSGQIALARQIAACHGSFHFFQDRYDDAELVWHKVMTHTDDSAAGVWTRLRFAAALIERGKAAEALPVLDACVEDAEGAGDEDPEMLPFALFWRGACAWDLDNYELARADTERGAQLARRVGLRLAELLNLQRAANALAMLRKGGEAVALAERAVAIAVGLGESSYELSAIHELAHICVWAGLHGRAARTCLRAIELSRELGSIRHEALAQGVLADAHHGLGDYDNAIRSLLHALPILRAHHARRHVALCLAKLGYAHEALQRYPEAIGYLSQAVDMFGELRLAGRAESAQQALDRCQQALRS
jgi:tetratricopeptide (TPR) repeat protein